MAKRTVIGTGFLTLDIILNGSRETKPRVHAGGSFGNVLTILSFLGLESFPIARLGKNDFSKLLLKDISLWNVNSEFIFQEEKGSTPIIIQRILKNKSGEAIHRFEFRNPLNGNWLPTYRPFLSKKVSLISDLIPKPQIYYFDRVSRASIDLARIAKEHGALIYFEPSNLKDSKQLTEVLKFVDIIKFSADRISNYRNLYPKRNAILEIETLGKEGVNFRFKSNKWHSLNSFNLPNISDSSGAGDWCSAGIIDIITKNGFLEDQKLANIKEAIVRGQSYGAINCLFDGARGAMYYKNCKQIKRMSDNLISGKFKNVAAKVLSSQKKIDYSVVESLLKTI